MTGRRGEGGRLPSAPRMAGWAGDARPVPVLCLLAAAACDLPPEGEPAAGPRVLATEPADGETGVDRGAEFSVFFDRPVLPRDVHRGHVIVASGVRRALLELRFDPVDRVLRARPAAPLDPEVRHRLEIEGLRDLDGRPMRERHRVAFDTGPQIGPPRPPPREVGWADVAPIFDGCAANRCHGGERPVLGLDLSSPAGLRRTALGVPAVQVRSGVRERTAPGAAAFVDLPRIDVRGGVGRPARSYLLYKVLGEARVVGERMPPPPAPRPSAEAVRRLAAWIASGAPTD